MTVTARALRGARLALATVLGGLVVGGLGTGTATAADGLLVRAEFRGCDVIRVVYSGYRADTIITWTVSQFGREIDRGAFVSGPEPPAAEQTVTLRLRTSADPRSDAEFVLDGLYSVRRKPQCDASGPTTTGPGIAPTRPLAPPTTAATGASGSGGGRPPGSTLPDEIADVVTGPEAGGESVSLFRGSLPAVILIAVMVSGLALLALARRPGPRKAPERPLPPWLHTPVPKKRSWYRKR